LNLFGFLGLFIGPVILAVTITLLGMLRDEGRVSNANPHEETAGAVAANDEGVAG